MPKLANRQKMAIKLPIIHIEKPLKLDRPVVVLPECTASEFSRQSA